MSLAVWEFLVMVADLAYVVVGLAIVCSFIVVALAALRYVWEGWDG